MKLPTLSHNEAIGPALFVLLVVLFFTWTDITSCVSGGSSQWPERERVSGEEFEAQFWADAAATAGPEMVHDDQINRELGLPYASKLGELGARIYVEYLVSDYPKGSPCDKCTATIWDVVYWDVDSLCTQGYGELPGISCEKLGSLILEACQRAGCK